MHVVGMMSGTSLDGMDLVLCSFSDENGNWNWHVEKAVTLDYPDDWRNTLATAHRLTGGQLMLLHNEYGTYIGKAVKDFIEGYRADLIASHGHTVFHQPERRMTFQLGNPAFIAAECGLPVAADFRNTDIALGGQGAPLVPVGDSLLFGRFEFCLNLGGFANISNDVYGKRIACDLVPVNIVANELAAQTGMPFDRDGLTGREGNIIGELVNEFNELDFYRIKGPKSLGREWVETVFLPVLEKYKVPVADQLRSFYEHVAVQISNYINEYEAGEVLVTGGGAYNKFLVELIGSKTRSGLFIPDDDTVKYKEAIIFAFLGLLRFTNRVNCLASVTGATADSSAGAVYSGTRLKSLK